MIEETTAREATSPTAPDGHGRRWSGRVIVVIVLGLIVAMVAFDRWAVATAATPGERSPEVGFGRDMMQHHAQAVDMAVLLRDRSDDPEMRQLALDILLTQQAQIGQMQGWLSVWGQPPARTEPAMAWMGMPTTGPMPGMATADDLNRLRDLRGREADAHFLRLMIPHHQAGVAMARAVLERTQRPEVRALAEAIVAGQESEIAAMQALHQRLGAPPAPAAPGGHESHD